MFVFAVSVPRSKHTHACTHRHTYICAHTYVLMNVFTHAHTDTYMHTIMHTLCMHMGALSAALVSWPLGGI